MRKQAKDLKKDEKISIAGQIFKIVSIEISDIGKQGKRKVRLELINEKEEKLVIIRPEDYPIDSI